MSRLYIEHESDLRKGTGKCASETAQTAIYWGSAKDSKLCARITVNWPKGADKPEVLIYTGSGVDVKTVTP